MGKALEKAGLRFLDLVFRERTLHDGIMHNIKTAIKSKESIPDSKEFSKNLIKDSFQTSEVKQELKKLSLRIVKSAECKDVSGSLVKEVI